jgi:hypothetical protein
MSSAKKRSTVAKKLELDLTKLKRKTIPYEFVLDELAPLSPWTRPMFGCLAVYIGEKIVLILRDKPTYPRDNGVWIATTHEHHDSLRAEFPTMRSIGLLGKKVTGWQILPAEAPEFEASALHACELIGAGDPRIGKVPGERRKTQSRIAKTARSAKRRA